MGQYIHLIEHLVTEEPDLISEDVEYDVCPECGGLFAAITDDGTSACINRSCPNYYEEYGDMLTKLHEFAPAFVKRSGQLLTARGVTIPFIGIKDMGRYYVVYIPSPHVSIYRRGRPKHLELTTAEKKFPIFRVHIGGENDYHERDGAIEALKILEQHLLVHNAPPVLLNHCRQRLKTISGEPPYKGALGAMKYTHQAKIITINKKNVEEIIQQA